FKTWPPCVRLVQVTVCWRRYLTERNANSRSRKSDVSSLQNWKVSSATETARNLVLKVSLILQSKLEGCCDALVDADGPKLQRLDQRQRNKTPGLLYTISAEAAFSASGSAGGHETASTL
uniref:Uncharacterized protein n=1 Tax=Mastacembelus armatus TaxID=205130 RepID=A0A7N8YLE0_9TELE